MVPFVIKTLAWLMLSSRALLLLLFRVAKVMVKEGVGSMVVIFRLSVIVRKPIFFCSGLKPGSTRLPHPLGDHWATATETN